MKVGAVLEFSGEGNDPVFGEHGTHELKADGKAADIAARDGDGWEPAKIAALNESSSDALLIGMLRRVFIERLIRAIGQIEPGGRDQKIDLRKELAQGLLNLGTNAHGLQVVDCGVVQGSFETSDLPLIRECFDRPTANEALENGRCFGIDDGCRLQGRTGSREAWFQSSARRWISRPIARLRKQGGGLHRATQTNRFRHSRP